MPVPNRRTQPRLTAGFLGKYGAKSSLNLYTFFALYRFRLAFFWQERPFSKANSPVKHASFAFYFAFLK